MKVVKKILERNNKEIISVINKYYKAIMIWKAWHKRGLSFQVFRNHRWWLYKFIHDKDDISGKWKKTIQLMVLWQLVKHLEAKPSYLTP